MRVVVGEDGNTSHAILNLKGKGAATSLPLDSSLFFGASPQSKYFIIAPT
jgi:hypothetical protein